jgi:hypothetical protein
VHGLQPGTLTDLELALEACAPLEATSVRVTAPTSELAASLLNYQREMQLVAIEHALVKDWTRVLTVAVVAELWPAQRSLHP